MATKAQPKKAQPKPVEGAVAEATTEVVTVDLDFRGEIFAIPAMAFASPQFGLALAAGRFNDIAYSLLSRVGDNATRRFLSVCTTEDTMMSVAVEFINAATAAAGQGNSSTS